MKNLKHSIFALSIGALMSQFVGAESTFRVTGDDALPAELAESGALSFEFVGDGILPFGDQASLQSGSNTVFAASGSNTVFAAGNGLGFTGKTAGNGLGSTGEAAENGLGFTGKAAGNGLGFTGKAAGNGLGFTGKAAGNGLGFTGKTAGNGLGFTGEAAENGLGFTGKAAGNGLGFTGKAAGNGLGFTGKAAGNGLGFTGKSAGNGLGFTGKAAGNGLGFTGKAAGNGETGVLRIDLPASADTAMLTDFVQNNSGVASIKDGQLVSLFKVPVDSAGRDMTANISTAMLELQAQGEQSGGGSLGLVLNDEGFQQLLDAAAMIYDNSVTSALFLQWQASEIKSARVIMNADGEPRLAF